MNRFRALGSLVGASLLMFAMVGTVAADAPTYFIDVTKSADPPIVPVSGSVVTFTISVENTGTGDFHTLGVVDTLAGCTVAYDSGDTNLNAILDGGASAETWNYTCSVAGVTPETENTATVHACHNSSPSCTQANQTTSGESNTVVVGLCESDCVVVTPAPPTAEPTDVPLPPTDAAFNDPGTSPAQGIWMLIIALGAVLGSLVVLRPSRIGRTR